MRAYLDAMDAAEIAVTAPDRNVVLAALGPKMLALAGERTKGALPYNVTPEHTAEAKRILGPDRWLCVEQKICFTTDAAMARAVAAEHLSRYMPMPNYRNNWLRLGFSESELSGGGNDRFLDAMVAWGDEKTIRAKPAGACRCRRDPCLHPAAQPGRQRRPRLEGAGGAGAVDFVERPRLRFSAKTQLNPSPPRGGEGRVRWGLWHDANVVRRHLTRRCAPPSPPSGGEGSVRRLPTCLFTGLRRASVGATMGRT